MQKNVWSLVISHVLFLFCLWPNYNILRLYYNLHVHVSVVVDINVVTGVMQANETLCIYQSYTNLRCVVCCVNRDQ